MHFKVLLKVFLGLLITIALYLSVVFIWASSSVTQVLPVITDINDSSILSEEQKHILLKIEDPVFYSHHGLNISQGQGLTTITSSLSRNLFLFGKELPGIKGGFQSFYRGVFECCKKIDLGRDVMALVLNRNLSKDHQLYIFVTSSYMGTNYGKSVIGLKSASNTYFEKSISELSNDEFITLVAMLKAPDFFHPIKGSEELKIRVANINKILDGTCKASGWLDTSYKHCARAR
jgi:membrane carboxypeptidase/penicillin-binding protein